MPILSRITDRNIVRVYVATFGLGLAYGMAISLLALFLDRRGFDKTSIGSLAAWFAAGIVLFSLPMGVLIRRFSAKATLVASLLGYACTVSLFPFLRAYEALAAVRFVDGACSVGIWVSSETILLARSDEKNKAFVTSLYAITMAVGYVVGPALARTLVGVAPFSVAFVTAGAIALACGTYVATRLDRDPPVAATKTAGAAEGWSAPRLLWAIKTSCFATFAYGYFQASVVLFLPLYLVEDKSIAPESTILITAFFAAGMLLFSNLFGRIGDKRGHLVMMRGLGTLGAAMILGFVWLDSWALMCGAVFVAGATLASISPLSLALQGVVVPATDYSRANAMYNAFYAGGMLLGPPISSALFEGPGGPAMLFHLAALWAAFVVFSIVFYRDDPAAKRTPTLAPSYSK